MIDFSTWSLNDAKEYAQAYSSAVRLRDGWLAEEVAATRGPLKAVQGPEGLQELWRWATRRIDKEGPATLTLATSLPGADPQAGPRPPWSSPDQPNPYLSDGLLWLIDALGCHLAAMAMDAEPDARWEVYRAPNRRDVNQNRTMLAGVPGAPADPASMVYGQVIGHVVHGKAWKRAALSELYHYLVDPLHPGSAHR